MLKRFNSKEQEKAAAIIGCGAMEAETISKTRASLKSHKSKENNFNFYKMKKTSMIFFTISFFLFAFLSCSIFHKTPSTPTGFIRTNDVGWSTIQLRDGLKFEKAFDDVLDVISKRFEMDMISKEGAYARSQWSYRWGVTEGTSYRTRVIFKFSPDKTKVDVKTEAEWLQNNVWQTGYDTRLLETIKQDIMGFVGRVTM
jgi:hypothetical protein